MHAYTHKYEHATHKCKYTDLGANIKWKHANKQANTYTHIHANIRT